MIHIENGFSINDINCIYGIANVQESKYKQGLTQFLVSNIFQIKKILADSSLSRFIAISVNPAINAQKNSKIREIVQIYDYKSNGIVHTNNRVATTGYGTVFCKSVLLFNDLAQNRTFFEIRPHGQYLIKQLFPFQSDNIVKYINKI